MEYSKSMAGNITLQIVKNTTILKLSNKMNILQDKADGASLELVTHFYSYIWYVFLCIYVQYTLEIHIDIVIKSG